MKNILGNISLSLSLFSYTPANDTPEDKEAAERNFEFQVNIFLTGH